jgi:hypothetical protein
LFARIKQEGALTTVKSAMKQQVGWRMNFGVPLLATQFGKFGDYRITGGQR